MKQYYLLATIVALCATSAAAQGKTLTNDPLTGLPLIPATDAMHRGNAPVRMPDGRVCQSGMQGNFYSIYNYFATEHSKTDAVLAWYTSKLTGFRRFHGYDSKRSQDVFYNADGTTVVIVTGTPGADGVNTNSGAVAYERYQPGLSEKTIKSLTQGKIACQ